MIDAHKKAVVAPFKGLSLCLKNKELRKLSFWPFIHGIVAYLTTMITAYFLLDPVYNYFELSSKYNWGGIINKLIYLCTIISLLVSSFLISAITLIISSSFYQSAIAKTSLSLLGESLPEEESLSKETARTIFSEILKLIWLIPLLVILFIAGLIPLLSPFCFLAASWLLAYQFVDISLDVKRFGAIKRLLFSLRHASKLILFGAILTICWSVPFLGILLLPSAAAGASYLIASINEESNLEEEEEEEEETKV